MLDGRELRRKGRVCSGCCAGVIIMKALTFFRAGTKSRLILWYLFASHKVKSDLILRD